MLSLLIVSLAAASVLAQSDGPAPGLNANPTDTSVARLNGKAFDYAKLPYHVDTFPGGRGPQSGFNICNSTTEGQDSLCQTLIANDLKDFCLWAPPKLSPIGDAEGEVVAWCTQPGHGARVIPAGTITGAQFIKTPSYIEFTGIIKGPLINIPVGPDSGGELDSGGQDLRGNPIGGVAYSSNMPKTSGVITQSRVWHQFIGSQQFCMKFCDNSAPNAAGICRHTLDTVGCEVNVPAAYQDGVFLACEGDDQDPVAIGDTKIPASSKCTTYASTDLWPAGPAATSVPSGASSASKPSSSSTTSGISKPAGSSKPSGSSGTSSGAPSSSTDATGAASSLSPRLFVVAAAVGLLGVAFAA